MSWITKREIIFFKKLTKDKHSQFDNEVVKKQDIFAKEVPVALVYNGISHTVMMCSPQDLEDFALGFSLTEGIIDKPSDIYGIDVVEACNGIEVQIELSSRQFARLKDHRRTLTGRTGCGICGSEQLNQIFQPLNVLENNFQFDLNNLDDCLNKLFDVQQLAKETGSTHAAGFFTAQGELIALREDVGRHVALDKLLGWHAKAGKPQGFVIVTSRASYEMVQKTVAAGVEMLVAISAGTDLAIEMAEKYNLSLLGFAREGRATIYSGAHRFGL